MAIAVSACRVESDYPRSFAGYTQVALSASEREKVVEHVAQRAVGTSYRWGGDTLEGGFDCSGLIQWAFRQQGFGEFRNGDDVYDEITAHDLYHDNSIRVASLAELARGDLIFFDENGDGQITHNAIFDRYDTDTDKVWVYDAYSREGEVTHRVVDNFRAKGPLYGKPLKTVRQ